MVIVIKGQTIALKQIIVSTLTRAETSVWNRVSPEIGATTGEEMILYNTLNVI